MCAHLCVARERANSVVEVGCRNFFLRLGMEPVSPGVTDPGVPQRKGSTDGARCSGFPPKQQLRWVQGDACESLSPPRLPRPSEPLCHPSLAAGGSPGTSEDQCLRRRQTGTTNRFWWRSVSSQDPAPARKSPHMQKQLLSRGESQAREGPSYRSCPGEAEPGSSCKQPFRTDKF